MLFQLNCLGQLQYGLKVLRSEEFSESCLLFSTLLYCVTLCLLVPTAQDLDNELVEI